MEGKVSVVSEELIRPLTQTSSHLQSFTFSALDQLAPPNYVPFVFYYPHKKVNDDSSSTRSLQLKTSLSKVLVDLYPFAGRRVDGNSSISCNDDGVLFIEAFAHNYDFKDVLTHSGTSITAQFLPKLEDSTTVVLLIQVTFFECGGMIIGVWFSHKLADAASFSTFIKYWADMNRGSSTPESLIPDFTTGAKLFPPIKHDQLARPLPILDLVQEHCISKTFVFGASSIAKLVSKSISEDVARPTRVEAVSALIWKCATTSTTTRPSSLIQVINFRKRLVPPLPSETIGNYLAYYKASKGASDKDLQKLVSMLRKGLLEFHDINSAKNITWDLAYDHIMESSNMLGDMLSQSDTDLYLFTSTCGMPMYGADFGWGKPACIGVLEFNDKNTVMLMDGNDGGIEAWISLEIKHMAEFEQHPDLLTFARIKNGSS